MIHTGDNDDDEPYIQALEAQIVYYVEDHLDKNWFTRIHLKPRDLYKIVEDDVENSHECDPFEQKKLRKIVSR